MLANASGSVLATTRSDGFYVNLGGGMFVWRYPVLPAVQGRNGLSPHWDLHHNSRAHSLGGNFGKSPFDLFCFERVRKDASGDIIWQEHEVREFLFDQTATGGETAAALYYVVSETSTERQLTTPPTARLESR